VLLNALASTLAGASAVLAILYTSAAGGAMHKWSHSFLAGVGVSPARQALVQRWWFKEL
jgi:hypothetical protein